VSLTKVIKLTLAYAKHFGYSPNTKEVYLWLISDKTYPYPLVRQICQKLGLNLSPKKRLPSANIEQKIKIANRFSSICSLHPSIQMIALTGSIAAGNAKESDDIDLLIITSPNILWLVRPLVTIVAQLFFGRTFPKTAGKNAPDAICLNLWLDSTALSVPQSKRNLYTAHEVLMVKPILNRNNTYQAFINANNWTKKYLFNAYQTKSQSSSSTFTLTPTFWIWRLLNYLLYRVQYLYMRPKITNESIDLHYAYFHPQNRYLAIKDHLLLK